MERLTAALADRYRVERELGAGGMATVYLAEDLKHHRKVAVKVLRADLAASLGPERFLREVTIAANLQHPHVLPLYDSGQSDGFLYYVMPYVEGTSLRQKLIREGELPIPDAVRILRDIADAMAYAHQHGVVHRDIKPENVMLSGRHALVTDFGVAKAVSEATGRQTLTTAGVALGTPTYMAPEQAAADPHTDHRADIYAFGVVAYELLTGRPPFTGASPQAVLGAHVTMAPDPVSKYRPSIPPALAALVMRCLEKLPADRWQSADELIPQLEAVLTPSGGMTPTTTQPIPSALVTRMRARRRRIGLAVAGAAVLGLAVLGWLFFFRAPAIDPELVLVAPFENQTGDASLDRLGLEVSERLSLALAQAGVGKPVAATRIRELIGASGRGSAELAKKIARQVGAGLLVSGTYSGSQARLEVRVELLRMPAGRQVAVVEPVTGAVGSIGDSLGERLAVAVAANHDWGDDYGWGRDHRLPRSLAAYRAQVAGDGYYFKDGSRAAEYHRQALELDPGWPSPMISLWLATGSDSIAKALEQQSATLLPGDRDVAEEVAAVLRQDWEGAYRAVSARLRVDSVTWAIDGAAVAYRTDRLHEVLAHGARRHLPSYWTDPARRSAILHSDMAWALHGLGKHQEELALALETRQEFPEEPLLGVTLEIQARAGLGQVAEVERLVAEAEGLRPRAGSAGWGQSRAIIAAHELLAHDHADAARRVAARGAQWFVRHLAERPDDVDLLGGYAQVLCVAGPWQEELVVGTRLLALARTAKASPDNAVLVLGHQYSGEAEARLGHRDRALAASRDLSAVQGGPNLTARVHFARAVIHAALGDTAAAMDLFRAAYEGAWDEARLSHLRHREPALLLLRDYPAYRELTKVRD